MLSAKVIKNAPEGAQRYYQGDTNCAYLRMVSGVVIFKGPMGWEKYRDISEGLIRWSLATPLPSPDPKSRNHEERLHTINEMYGKFNSGKKDLTTLDTPFGELDRATQLALCEHVLDGGEVEKYVDDNWEPKAKKLHCLSFMAGVKYRAKAKKLTRVEVLEGKLKEIEAELKALKDGE